MAKKRALTIGVCVYGEGFPSLPAVENDVVLVERALKRLGYDVQTLDDAITKDGIGLRGEIEAFIQSCRADDVHILYFSGHGIHFEDSDYLIPAGVSYAEATNRNRPESRVVTDFSYAMTKESGLVVFMIDACRSGFGNSAAWGRRRPSNERHIQFYGCSADEVCRVLDSGLEGKPVSVFAKALSEVLMAGHAPSLQQVLDKVHEVCEAMGPGALRQRPTIGHAELSPSMAALLSKPIFETPPQFHGREPWNEFDPSKFHCLVIISEKAGKEPPVWTLGDLVHGAMIGVQAQRIWGAFHACWDGALLVSGQRRNLEETVDPQLIQYGELSINVALSTIGGLRKSVRALIEADLVVFDVTGFEPGVMMLMGVRAASRRGVTVSSHGGTWREGQPLEKPFNLQDISIGSHTPPQIPRERESVVAQFIDRVKRGFEQLARQPGYLDLPAYDPLRRLGSAHEASSTIPIKTQISVLCPYERDFWGNWIFLSSSLETALNDKPHKIGTKARRVIDQSSPQLFSQMLYEELRRTAACVADWTAYSPSVFLEFGVRLAVSEWGVVSVIDESYVSKDPLAKEFARLDQVKQLAEIFRLFRYSPGKRDGSGKSGEFEEIAKVLVGRHPHFGADELSPIHEETWQSVSRVHRTIPNVFEELATTADSLSHPGRERTMAPQILFYQSGKLKLSSEAAARERRIAAWLYLDTRMRGWKWADEQEKEHWETSYRELGRAAAVALYDLGGDENIRLAEQIESRIETSGNQLVTVPLAGIETS